jgi:hypothetical protein
MTPFSRLPLRSRGRHTLAAPALFTALLTATLVPGLAQLPALADDGALQSAAPSGQRATTLGDAWLARPDLDRRGTALPSLAQRTAVAGLGAVDVRWNEFGTPTSLLPASGSLGAAGSADAVTAARRWLHSHAAVFGFTPTQMDRLELVNDQKLAQSPARAVLLRQQFGGVSSASGGLVTVGVANGQIAYVSSSLVKTSATSVAPAVLSPLQGWLKAASDAGLAVPATKIGAITSKVSDGWTRLRVPGFVQEQQVRLRALALADGTVRPVFVANVVNVAGARALAYTTYVDAVTGDVLLRHNQVDNEQGATPFNGEITATDCGPKHEFTLGDDKTKQIDAVAAMANSADDIVVKLYGPGDVLLASGDLGTSPEQVSYTADSIPAGKYAMQVCPFDDPTAPALPPYNYAAMVTTSDSGAPDAADAQFPPRWRLFAANPSLDSLSPTKQPKNSVVGCWVHGKGCTLSTGTLINLQAPGPWDTDPRTGQSTQTTTGNNAVTHEAWLSPLTPGGTAQAPVSPTRWYTEKFTDVWNDSKCDPTNLHPGGNDINAVVTNLFVGHNRMHDYSYYLGFTERNYNAQIDNLGRGGAQNDPEIGNVQAGALDGGTPSYLGRDNANQIALQDGISGITNQYLFQPLAGAFYSPCTDGSMDTGVFGHEYTHLISNRMIGGPDDGITSEQGGAMGESWGDLTASEYQFSHGYRTGVHPFIEGAYATGNRKTGIRDYAIYKNPLNYSDYGFDTTGVEVHADGEIWNGTQWSVRQALVKKYNRKYPYTSRKLQAKCSEALVNRAPRRAVRCPGNRRWIQLMYDAFLLQQGATSMLDARDAMLAADSMRFHGKDTKVMWNAFAKRGMGHGAKIKNADDGDPTPSFASPKARNAKVTFKTSGVGRIYVGKYEARVTPIADTIKKTDLGRTASFVPGTYSMLYASKTRGFKRFTMKVSAGQHRTIRVKNPVNVASAAAGAKILGASAGSLNAPSLIDGTEQTNWGGVNGDGSNVDQTSPWVTVDLAGKRPHRIHRVNVSAMLTPAPASATDVPLAQDPDSGSRFTALRKFALERCVRACGTAKATWHRFYVSSGKAFPAIAPRPVAPNLILRSFDVPDVRAAAIRFVALENQCTGFAGYAGEQDNDPTNDTDCKTASDRGTIVHAAELQVF